MSRQVNRPTANGSGGASLTKVINSVGKKMLRLILKPMTRDEMKQQIHADINSMEEGAKEAIDDVCFIPNI